MSRFARNVDSNQGDITKALRARGALVEPRLARVGGGVPDLLVGYKLQLAVFEGKPGDHPDTAKHKLNKNELEWHTAWSGYPVFLILSPEAAVEVLDAFDRIGQWPMVHRSFGNDTGRRITARDPLPAKLDRIEHALLNGLTNEKISADELPGFFREQRRRMKGTK